MGYFLKLGAFSILFSFLLVLYSFFICVEEQLDFPVLYASAKEGWASLTFTKSPPDNAKNMSPLLDSILKHVSPPQANLDEPFKMLVSNFVIFCILHCIALCLSVNNNGTLLQPNYSNYSPQNHM